jgi:diaminopimelate decarboxylase
MPRGYAAPVLQLFPTTAAVEDGELTLGGVAASALADEFGTPVVVYCEQTILEAARAYREAAPGALLVYGTKAFPNVAILRLLAAHGFGADVASLGELELARAAGISGEKLVVHGNNKSDEELRAAADAGALVVVDALDEVERAAAAGVRRALVRVTPGIEADTHEAIRTAHHGSKFGLPPDDALAAVRALLDAGVEVAGLHTHIGSQLVHLRAAAMTVEWLSLFATRCRVELDWTPGTIDLGGGLGVAHVEEEEPPSIADFVTAITAEVERWWALQGLEPPRLVMEPGRSLVGRAGVTLYRVGSVKRASESTTYVAVDGGISDNPRPALYGARYSALLANRAAEEPAGPYAVAGKHCESGDVLIQRVQLPAPRRGDLLAVPATGGYTLAMASNYNATLRPPAVLVADGEARLIRRRETVADLLALEQ